MKYIIIPLLFISTGLMAQESKMDWFLNGAAGFSKRNYIGNPILPPLRREYQKAIHWEYTVGFQYKISKYLYLESGLSFINIRNKEVTKRTITDFNYDNFPMVIIDTIGEVERQTTLEVRYLAIPSSILFKYKKIGLRTGLRLMYFFESRVVKTKLDTTYFSMSESLPPLFIPIFIQFPGKPSPNKIDLGLLLGLHYRVTKNLSLNTSFYSSLKEVNKLINTRHNTREILSLNLGLSYHL